MITALTVRIRPAPEQRIYEGWRLPSFAAGADVVRRLVQDGPLPTVLRLSDEAETALNLARPGEIGQGGSGGCLAIVGFEGTREDVARAAGGGRTDVLERAGAEPADPGAGEAWAHDRYPRSVPARRAARRRRDRRDAGDGDVLVRAAATLRGGLDRAARRADARRARRR